jgi:excisionase family DNA binding protein
MSEPIPQEQLNRWLQRTERASAYVGVQDDLLTVGEFRNLVQMYAELMDSLATAEADLSVYLSAEEVSKRLGISRSSVHRLVRSGKLRAIQISPGTTSSYKIDPASLDEFISELEAK